VDEYVKDGYVVGVGSGSTVVYAAERLGELVREAGVRIKCIPTSFQAKQLIAQHRLVLTSLDEHPVIDVTIDGADEVDLALNCIKGGGGCQLQEKIVAFASKRFVVIADSRKESNKLGQQWTQGVPVEVIPMAYVPLMRRMEAMGGTPVLRMATAKAGPVVTDNGNFVLDVSFGVIEDPASLGHRLKLLPGVVEVGLFCGMAEKAYFGHEDGSITTREAKL
jgi:ribose 5-phosphate isomerase A